MGDIGGKFHFHLGGCHGHFHCPLELMAAIFQHLHHAVKGLLHLGDIHRTLNLGANFLFALLGALHYCG